MCVLSYARVTFCSCDLDLEPMTLNYENDLHVLKIWPTFPPKMKFLGEGFEKLGQEQHRHTDTDRRDRKHYHAAFAGGKMNV